jgi:DNA-binding NarL/FixJ family response regulator
MARLQSCAAAQAEGDRERAKRLLQEGLKLSAESGTNVAYSLDGLAATALPEGGLARLWGAAEALLEQIEAAAYIYALDRSVYQDRACAARAQLDEEAQETSWAEGRAITRERAKEYVFSNEEAWELPTRVAVPEQPQPPLDQRTGRLAARKQEIALPVGRGLTNRQIAQELSISERTAENHVGRILKKLGLHSRAVIAAWVAQSKHSPYRK